MYFHMGSCWSVSVHGFCPRSVDRIEDSAFLGKYWNRKFPILHSAKEPEPEMTSAYGLVLSQSSLKEVCLHLRNACHVMGIRPQRWRYYMGGREPPRSYSQSDSSYNLAVLLAEICLRTSLAWPQKHAFHFHAARGRSRAVC
jgi:hypothetical protein